jgi:hypothetical protein
VYTDNTGGARGWNRVRKQWPCKGILKGNTQGGDGKAEMESQEQVVGKNKKAHVRGEKMTALKRIAVNSSIQNIFQMRLPQLFQRIDERIPCMTFYFILFYL